MRKLLAIVEGYEETWLVKDMIINQWKMRPVFQRIWRQGIDVNIAGVWTAVDLLKPNIWAATNEKCYVFKLNL